MSARPEAGFRYVDNALSALGSSYGMSSDPIEAQAASLLGIQGDQGLEARAGWNARIEPHDASHRLNSARHRHARADAFSRDHGFDSITGSRLGQKHSSHQSIERIQVNQGYGSVDVGLKYPVEDVAEITLPVTKKGKLLKGDLPVVVLLHGQHESLYFGDKPLQPLPAWAAVHAEDGDTLVPSYQGYRYVADALARDGRVVVSISADGVNAQTSSDDWEEMVARGSLVEHHLRALASGTTGTAYDRQFKKNLDLGNVVLMGHSRGGEGVVNSVQQINRLGDSDFAIGGVMNFAPVNFNFSAVGSIPVVNLLPSCDGDVSDLEGQTYVERARDLYGASSDLQASVWLAGGNHNYLNTEWTPGLSVSDTGEDDASALYEDGSGMNGHCDVGNRLSPKQERVAGREYLVAFARMIQDGDRGAQRLFDGSSDGSRKNEKQGIQAKSSSIGGDDRSILIPSPSLRLKARGVSAEIQRASASPDPAQIPAPLASIARDWQDEYETDLNPLTAWLSPFWSHQLPRRYTIGAEWDSKGVIWAGLDSPMDLSQSSGLASRVVLDPGESGRIKMAIRDRDGRSAILPLTTSIDRRLTTKQLDLRLWPQILRAPLSSDLGVDLTKVVDVGFKVAGQGRAWVLGISETSGRSDARRGAAELLPSARVERGVIPAQPGLQTVMIPVTLDAPAQQDVEVYARVGTHYSDFFDQPPSYEGVVTIPAGQSRADIPVSVGWPEASVPLSMVAYIYTLSGAGLADSKATQNLVSANGQYPLVSVADAYAQARPGDVLEWELRLANEYQPRRLEAIAVDGSQIFRLDVTSLPGGSYRLSMQIDDENPVGLYEFDLELKGAVLDQDTQLVARII